MHAKSLQSCPTLCDPIDCSLPCSSVHGILHARIWGSSQRRDQTHISYVSYTGRQVLYHFCHLGSPIIFAGLGQEYKWRPQAHDSVCFLNFREPQADAYECHRLHMYISSSFTSPHPGPGDATLKKQNKTKQNAFLDQTLVRLLEGLF